MKRTRFLAVALIALLFGSAMGTFAVEFEFAGTVETGVRASFDEDNGKNIILYSDDYDADGVGVATTFGVSVIGENWGAEVELGTENDVFAFGYAYGWMSFADELLKVKAGAIDDDTWATHGDAEYDFFSVNGVQLIFAPFDGLSFGMGAEVSPNLFEVANLEGESDISDFSDGIAFGAAYESELFAVQAAYLLAGAAYVGVDVSPLEVLGFTVELALDDINSDDADMLVTVDELVAWQITDSFAAELLCYQVIDTAEDADVELSFEPAVSYQVTDNLGLSLGAGYTICGDDNSFYVKPGLGLAVSDNAEFNLFYKYDSADGEDDNVVQFDFIWNF